MIFEKIMAFHQQLYRCLDTQNRDALEQLFSEWDPDDDTHIMNQPLEYGPILAERTSDPLLTILHLSSKQCLLLRDDAFRLAFLEYYTSLYYDYTPDKDWNYLKEYLHTMAPLPVLISPDSPLTRMYEHYYTALSHAASEIHCGDCTSVSSPCIKCLLECQLNIDTISHVPKKIRRELKTPQSPEAAQLLKEHHELFEKERPYTLHSHTISCSLIHP